MLSELLAALRFLTILRPGPRLHVAETTLGRSAVFFPAVGLFLGGCLWLCDRALFFLPVGLRALALVGLSAVLSRASQLDGLAATVDGLLEGADRDESLAAMRRRCRGTFGALGVVLVLLLKLRSLDELEGGYRAVALLLAPMLSRWSLVVMAYSSRPAGAEGPGRALVQEVRFREFGLASALAWAAAFALAEVMALPLLVAVAGVSLLLTLYCNRRFGGASGDTLGALGELSEALVLFLCALVGRATAPA